MNRKETIKFHKLQASGNDFILIDAAENNLPKDISCFAGKVCRRRFGIGADGLLLIERNTDGIRMRIFNADGSEAGMCGNGARCSAFWLSLYSPECGGMITFMTGAGKISAEVERENSNCGMVRLKMTDPVDLRTGKNLESFPGQPWFYVNTGVPHTVFFVPDTDAVEVERKGSAIRRDREFLPAGTNVDFVRVKAENHIKIRTYERGVEGETLACGTGAVASSIAYWMTQKEKNINDSSGDACAENREVNIKVETKSGEVLEVFFSFDGKDIYGVWLKGKAYMVYYGVLKEEGAGR